MKMEQYKRNAKMTLLKPYCHHAKDNDFIEITEWSNGEGFDVHFSSQTNERHIQLTWGELEALQVAVLFKG